MKDRKEIKEEETLEREKMIVNLWIVNEIKLQKKVDRVLSNDLMSCHRQSRNFQHSRRATING